VVFDNAGLTMKRWKLDVCLAVVAPLRDLTRERISLSLEKE
jgi:hypothetical protein